MGHGDLRLLFIDGERFFQACLFDMGFAFAMAYRKKVGLRKEGSGKAKAQRVTEVQPRFVFLISLRKRKWEWRCTSISVSL